MLLSGRGQGEQELILGMLVIDEPSSDFSFLDVRGLADSGQDELNPLIGWHVNAEALVSPATNAAWPLVDVFVCFEFMMINLICLV